MKNAAILETDKQWADATAEGRDIERIISFWTDDMTPSGLGGVLSVFGVQ
jgi:ketosteroid isomerase-like protein